MLARSGNRVRILIGTTKLTVRPDVAQHLTTALTIGGASISDPHALRTLWDKGDKVKVPRSIKQRQLAVRRHLLQALKAHDKYSLRHSIRVAMYSKEVAKARGLSSDEVKQVKEEALLHDIGKLGISTSIINSKRQLSLRQRAKVMKHTSIGAEIIKAIPVLSLQPENIKGHHERLDGGGYHHVDSNKISEAARIIAVADTFDAMTSNRSYHKGSSRTTALKILTRESIPLRKSRLRSVHRNLFDRRMVNTLKGLFPHSRTARAALRHAKKHALHPSHQ